MLILQLVLMPTSLYFYLEMNYITNDFHAEHHDYNRFHYLSRSPGFNAVSHTASISRTISQGNVYCGRDHCRSENSGKRTYHRVCSHSTGMVGRLPRSIRISPRTDNCICWTERTTEYDCRIQFASKHHGTGKNSSTGNT